MPFNISKEDFEKIMQEIYFPTLAYRSIPKDYKNPKNISEEICKECQGACCKKCGCHFSPDDFSDISFESLKKELEKGYISIDSIDGDLVYSDVNVFILRIRNVGAPIVDTDIRKKSPCILLTKSGCKLDYAKRPSGGKLLIPRKEMKCSQTYNMIDCSYEWLPHKKVLHELAEYFKDKDFPCTL